MNNDYKKFFSDIKQNRRLPFYIFIGKDLFLIRKAIEALKTKNAPTQMLYYFSKDIKPKEFWQEFTQRDIFSCNDAKKICVLLEFEQIKEPKNFFTNILKFCSPEQHNHIILWVFNEEEFKKKLKKIGTSDLSQNIFYFDHIPEKEALQWIRKEFEKKGIIASHTLLKWIYDQSSPSLWNIYNTFQLLSLAYDRNLPSIRELEKEPIFRRIKTLNRFVSSLIFSGFNLSSLREIFKYEYGEEEINAFMHLLIQKLSKQKGIADNIYKIAYTFSILQKELRSKNISKIPYFNKKIVELLIEESCV